LDYNFSSAGYKSAELMSLGDDTTGDQPSIAAMAKTIGPFSISSIGLAFDLTTMTLEVHFDASVKLGPIEMVIIGFMMGVTLSGCTLSSLPTPKPTINGLGVSYNEPLTTIAGSLNSTNELYLGGIDVGFSPYGFIAEGGYGTVIAPVSQQDDC
jgi:hypothetical protein